MSFGVASYVLNSTNAAERLACSDLSHPCIAVLEEITSQALK
jgi:hypothetical protein